MNDNTVERVARAIEIAFVERTMHHPVSEFLPRLGWLWPHVARAALATTPVTDSVLAERERAAAMLEKVVAEGYDTPANKVDQCEHGKFGWEDCIACYDAVLIATAAAIRSGEGS